MQNNTLNPAAIVGRRLNEEGIREDNNKTLGIVQCLEVGNGVKSRCLTTVEKDTVIAFMPPGRYPGAYSREDLHFRTLHPIERERLQTVPDNYTAQVSTHRRVEMTGNAWTVDVVAHIFKSMEIKEINVLSLFDGMSCGQIALERAGFKVGKYFSSEVDKHAIKVTQHNYPNTIQIGDVTKVRYENGILYTENGNFEVEIHLLIGGSPCQGFSFAGKQLNFDDPRSKLFFEYSRILDEINPKYFLLENVKMKREFQDIISAMLGVEPVEINSALVSAQNRKRLYWTNIPDVGQPEDKGIFLKDIVLDDAFPVVLHNLYGGFNEKTPRVFQDKSPTLRTAAGGGHIPSVVTDNLIHSEKALEYMDREVSDGRTHWDFKHHSDVRDPKSAAVVANFFKGIPYNVLKDWNCIRKFHPVECERLQTVPDGYTAHVSDTQRYRMLGNGWTVDVVAYIFSKWKSI